MNWKEFKLLSLEERLEYFNSHSVQIQGLVDTCKALGFNKSTVQSHFKKYGYIYNKELSKYTLNDSTQNITTPRKVSPEVTTPHKVSQEVTKPRKAQYVTMEQFKALQDEIQAIKDILDNAPTINTDMLDVEEVKLSVSKTMRVSPQALERFENFCKAFPQYSKHSILSHIINSFINNYENNK